MRKQLEDFVCALQQNRLMLYKAIPQALGWNIWEGQICRALKREGFSRRTARMKPLISEANRVAQLEWARAHLHWTEEQ